MTSLTASVTRLPVAADKLGYFRFGRLGEGWIVTNEHGEWHHFDDAGFRAFVAGDVDEAHPERDALAAKGFLRQGLDLEELAQSIRRRKRHVGGGPTVHALRLADGDRRLAVEKAKDILDFAMLSTSAALELRLVPGDAPVDLDLLGFLVQYATEKNRYEGKALTWTIRVDPATLDDATVAWLADRRFELRAPMTAAGPSEVAAAKITAFREAAAARKREGAVVAADVIVDASTLGALPALPDALAALGVKKLRVEPVVRGASAVDADTFAAAYREVLARLIGLGAPVEETAAAVVHLATQTEPGADVGLRSPSAGGLVAYDLDGRILPSEAAVGLDDDMFVLGTAGQTPYKEATTHATLRALTLASLLECLPGFADHWATPFLGVDPVRAFAATGDVFPKGPTTPEVRGLLAVVEAVFAVLVRGDEPAARLRTWAS
jgi:hypothetical protein